MRIIGLLEFLAAIGLILPAITGVLPWLTPLAASMLVVLMVFAIAFQCAAARRGSEPPPQRSPWRARVDSGVRAVGTRTLLVTAGRSTLD